MDTSEQVQPSPKEAAGDGAGLAIERHAGQISPAADSKARAAGKAAVPGGAGGGTGADNTPSKRGRQAGQISPAADSKARAAGKAAVPGGAGGGTGADNTPSKRGRQAGQVGPATDSKAPAAGKAAVPGGAGGETGTDNTPSKRGRQASQVGPAVDSKAPAAGKAAVPGGSGGETGADDYPSKRGRHIFNSFFVNKLIEGISSVKKWTVPKRLRYTMQATPDVPLHHMRRAVAPVNEKKRHWYLTVADFEKREIVVYDSIAKSIEYYKSVVAALKGWVSSYITEKDNLKTPYSTAGWGARVACCPVQTNGTDCGVFTIIAMDCIVRGLPFSHCQADINRLRFEWLHKLLNLDVTWVP
ncbi:hypothetical protein GPECTOR_15g449 [Gonium pectorale]|uniref:Ubiquitin-like protease family profile domain-containing protein n=1 Tax=Gonium pectorale TaxID=33097 RepID=A0A150GLT3_GONPE|nr:hypothetical protein GPECTOR_15g449 [Gonium pectorale]|eukprot:KXZ50764.1 hypothetical protein GPECTOR_15g449 [Gonium pectorale]